MQLPRYDQISLLSQGVALPLAAIERIHIDVIIEVLIQSYNELKLHNHNLDFCNEAEVTALMETKLNSLSEVNFIWGQLVKCVARGKECLSFDGSNIEKRPDLSIFLTNGNNNFPLSIEAKIIDKPKSKGERLYFENGISRFIKGEYAWARREALMLGYIRDGSTISNNLFPFLQHLDNKDVEEVLIVTNPISGDTSEVSGDLVKSRHVRNFQYLNRLPPDNMPGPIDIWHIWLS